MATTAPLVDNVSAPALTPPSSVPDTVSTSVPDGLAGAKTGDEPKMAELKDPLPPKPATIPRPVEVDSVPETPNNDGTPAGGTPRPVLSTEPEEARVAAPAKTQDPVIENISSKAPNGSGGAPPPVNPGSEQTNSAGEKRKAEEEELEAPGIPPSMVPATGNGADTADKNDDQRPEKKPKITEQIADKVTEIKDKIESKASGSAGKGKGGRPKKDKTAPPPVGRTARKTRSQGPVEGGTT